MLEIITSEANNITGALGRFHWTAAAVAWADSVGPLVRDAIRHEAPVSAGPGGGRLRDSIKYVRHTVVGGVDMEFGSPVPYAPIVVKGSRPHIIEAHAALALHWTDSRGEHFARSVHHPGTKPNDFMRKAVMPLVPMLERSFRTVIEREL